MSYREPFRRSGHRGTLVRLIALLIVATAVVPLGQSAPAEAAPLAGFSVEDVATGLTQPVSMAFLPDGRMLVLEKNGTIVIGDPSTVPMVTETYMTLANIDSGNERGLLDITLDPDFVSNGYIYLYYTPSIPGLARIARFSHTENLGGTTSRADVNSEVLVWEDTTGYESCCHYGGGLDFGPDGKIWLTTGDKFDGNRAQDLTDASGSVIRVNKDGTIPDGTDGWPSNPFIDGPGGNHDAIWAYGLRNPFRARWDLQTGRLLIGEVGGNDHTTAWEDVHLAKVEDAYAGIDYGWPNCEGVSPYTDFPQCTIGGTLAEPIFAYPHNGSGASLTGGVVYRGNQFPPEYDGAYFYGDYVRNFVRYVTFDAAGTVATGDFDFDVEGVGLPVAIEQGPDGYLYYVDIAGKVSRYVYADGNQAPVITSATATPTETLANMDVSFAGTATDNENDPLTFTWNFGDGTSASGANVTHQYAGDGLYDAYLEVADASRVTRSQAVTIQVGVPPVATIDSPLSGSLFRAGDVINYSGSALDGSGNPITDPSAYSWVVEFIHNTDAHPQSGPDPGTSGSFDVPTSGIDFAGNTAYRMTLTVTDSNGLKDVDVVEIYPDKVDVTFDTVPSGLNVKIDGLPYTTPVVRDTLMGLTHQIEAPSPQCEFGIVNDFVNWSDGGTQTHTYTVPTANDAVTANFSTGAPCSVVITDGLVMRLKAGTGVSAPSGTVASWTDLTTNGNDLAPTSGTPVLMPDALNGQDVVRFDGIDDGLGRTGFAALPLVSSDRSVFMVANYRGSQPGTGWAGLTWGATLCNQAFGPIRAPDGDLGVQGWCSANDYDSNVVADGAGWLTQSVIVGSNNLTHFKDGSIIDSKIHTFNTQPGEIRIGASLNDDQFLDMDIAEILVYDRALTEAERQQIEDYFEFEYFAPAVNVTAPAEGSIQKAQDVTVTWETGGSLASGDHVHLTLDNSGTPVSVTELTGSYTFTGLSDGSHAVRVEIAKGSHVVYPHVRATQVVNFEINTQPEVTLTSPVEGQTVRRSNVKAEWATSGDVLSTDHVHLTLDNSGTPVSVDQLQGSYIFSNLADGPHSVKVELAAGDHSVYANPEAADMANFDVDTALPSTVGLVLRLESDANVSTASGNLVAGWLDQSGNGNDLIAAGDPTIGTVDTPTGLPAISFDGVGDLLERTASLTGFSGANDDRSMFLVARYKGGSAWAGAAYGTGSPNQAFGLVANSDSAVLVLQGWGASSDLVSGEAGVGAGWLSQSAVHEAGVATMFKNGSAIGTQAQTYNTALSRLVLGEEIAGIGFADMDISAVLLYNRALTELERQQVEDYLQAKYLVPLADTPPSAPTSLVAGAGDLEVQLSWDPNAEADLAGYNIFRSTSSPVDTSGVPINGATPVAGTTYLDTTVVNGIGYFYAVTAVDAAGQSSPASGEAAATPEIDPPAAPTGLVAVPGDAMVALLWDANTEADLAGYNVFRSASSPVDTAGTPLNGVTLVTDTTFNDATTANGTQYFYAIVAMDTADRFSPASSEVSAVPAAPYCSAPLAADAALCLESDVGVAESGGAVVQWSDQSGLGNDLTSVGDPTIGSTTTPTGRSAISLDALGDVMQRVAADGITGLPAGSADRTIFTVIHYNAAAAYGGVAYGNGAANEAFGLVVNSSAGNLTVQGWGGSNDAVSAVAGTGAGWLSQSAVVSSNVLTHYKDGVLIDTIDPRTYATLVDRIVVGGDISGGADVDVDVAAVLVYNRALTEAERQQVEDYLQAKYLDGPPAAPASLVTVPGDGAVQLSWDANTEADLAGYDVFRSTLSPVDTSGTPLNGATPVTDAAFNDSAVVNGTGYFYVVVAVDTAGQVSVASNEASATPVIDPPTGLVALPGDSQVMLSWDAYGGANLAGYDLFRSTASPVDTSGAPLNGATLVTVESFIDSAVVNGTGYFYVVVAVDTAGLSSAASNEAAATPSVSACGAPLAGYTVLCLESDVGVADTAGAVTGWADQSTAGNDLSALGNPTVGVVTTPAGMPAISFDGDGDVLERLAADGIAGLPAGSADRTMFTVINYNAASTYAGAAYGNGGQNKAFGLVVNSSKGFLTVQGWGGSNDSVSAVAGTGTGWLSQSAVVSSNVLTHYSDGVLIDTRDPRTYATEVAAIRLGQEISGGGFVNVDIAAVLIYDRALSATERQQVEDYLQAKYGTGAG